MKFNSIAEKGKEGEGVCEIVGVLADVGWLPVKGLRAKVIQFTSDLSCTQNRFSFLA